MTITVPMVTATWSGDYDCVMSRYLREARRSIGHAVRSLNGNYTEIVGTRVLVTLIGMRQLPCSFNLHKSYFEFGTGKEMAERIFGRLEQRWLLERFGNGILFT